MEPITTSTQITSEQTNDNSDNSLYLILSISIIVIILIGGLYLIKSKQKQVQPNNPPQPASSNPFDLQQPSNPVDPSESVPIKIPVNPQPVPSNPPKSPSKYDIKTKIQFQGFANINKSKNTISLLGVRQISNTADSEFHLDKNTIESKINGESILDRINKIHINQFYTDELNKLDKTYDGNLKPFIDEIYKIINELPKNTNLITIKTINETTTAEQSQYIADLLTIIKAMRPDKLQDVGIKPTNNWPSELIDSIPLFKFNGFGHIQNKDNKISIVRTGGVSYEIDINQDNLQKIRDNTKKYHYFNPKGDDNQLIANLQEIITRTGYIISGHKNKSLDNINRMGEYDQKLISDFLKIIEAIEPDIKPFQITKDIVKPGFTFDLFSHIKNSNTTEFQAKDAVISIHINHDTILTVNLNDLENEENKQKIFNKGKGNYYNLIHCDDPAQMNIACTFVYANGIINNNNNCLNIDKITKQSYHDQEMIYDFLKMVEAIHDDSHQFVKDD